MNPGMTYGTNQYAITIEVAHPLLTARVIGQGDDRIRMGVVDELARDDCVQDRFDRWGGRIRVGHRRPLLPDHVGIAEFHQLNHLEQRPHADWRKARSFDRGQVPTRSFDENQICLIPEEVWAPIFDRGVATAVKDQVRLGAEQARAVNTERKGIFAKLRRFFRIPTVLHRPPSCRILGGESTRFQ